MKKTLVILFLGYSSIVCAQSTASSDMMFVMGMKYLKGLDKPYDPAKAFRLFQMAAGKSHPRSMNALGNMFLKGLSTPENVDSAIHWYTKAADHGHAEAYLNLGRLCQIGQLVKQDFAEAARYFRLGAAAGNLDCQNMIAYFHYKGIGLEQDYNKAFAIFSDLALKGHTNAQYFLGICYRNGYGTQANNAYAKEWLQKAAEKNDKQSLHELFEEPLPENISVVTNDLQQKVEKLKNYQERFQPSNSNNLSGEYKGFAIYYDFSGRHVTNIIPLTLSVNRQGAEYKLIWKEGDGEAANLKGQFAGGDFNFDSISQYTRNDHYSYRTEERFLFQNAKLNIKYIEDSVVLSGDVRFYSLKRGEPGPPMYISLSKPVKAGLRGIQQPTVKLSPNPATAFVRVNITLPEASKLQLQLVSANGSILQQISSSLLPVGNYIYTFDVQKIPAGMYLIRAISGEAAINSGVNEKFIKQ